MIAEIAVQLATLLENNIIVVFTVIDFLFKSAILVLLIKYTERSLSPYLASSHKHKLWMTATILLGILPISSMLSLSLFGEMFSSSNLTFITILVPSGIANNAELSLVEPNDWLKLIYVGYFAVLSYFLIRFGASFFRVLAIKKISDYEISQEIQVVLKRLTKTLGLKREVSLGINMSTNSPITFGVRNPTIILPSSFDLSDILLLENVLTHELVHIKRLDWITYILGYIIASISWFNPFIWRSLQSLRLEAEFTCDNAVIERGVKREDFALQLVKIAKRCLPALANSYLPAMRIIIESGTEGLYWVDSGHSAPPRQASPKCLFYPRKPTFSSIQTSTHLAVELSEHG
ncbi:MAG TPA: M56 family metallopeptidase [Gammaproteobacteria bacterium]|nr:M56 family metallopeptidase [Gammaproteobacteria bacterium]|tara:strand:+ start:587 stop:1630 length:1044 start_codon:yes stop_codon:yes gene_type:complete